MHFPGGRFKKEVVVDGQSYLLLIRDEGGGAPEYQVAVIIYCSIFKCFNYYWFQLHYC